MIGVAIKKQSDIYNVIGKNIKKYRKKKGLKQRELAEALYLSDSFIAKLESITHQTISIDTLEDIAEVLDCDIRDFFNFNSEGDINGYLKKLYNNKIKTSSLNRKLSSLSGYYNFLFRNKYINTNSSSYYSTC